MLCYTNVINYIEWFTVVLTDIQCCLCDPSKPAFASWYTNPDYVFIGNKSFPRGFLILYHSQMFPDILDG